MRSCGRRIRSAAAGPHGSVPPARRRSGAACGCPGSPPVRELRQETEAAELIAGLPRSPDRGDRISRLERPAGESLPKSTAKRPGVLPDSGTDPLGRSPPGRQAGAAVAAGGPAPEEGETVRVRARAIRDLLRDPGRSRRLDRGDPRRRPAEAAPRDADPPRAARRRRDRLSLGRPEWSEAVLPPPPRPVRARLDGAGLRQAVRAVEVDPARRGDGRRAPGPAVAPPPDRQVRCQQPPDAASDEALEGCPAHGLGGQRRRERPAGGGIANCRRGRPEVFDGHSHGRRVAGQHSRPRAPWSPQA